MSMTSAEREHLKDNIREIVAGDDGIEMDTELRWVVSGIKEPVPFFQSLSLLLSPDAILYFEGCSVAPDVSAFYESHRAHSAVAVVRDTIFPVSGVFHVSFTSEVVTRLCELAASRPSKELFDHVKAYRDKVLLLHFHDAFYPNLDRSLLISERIAEASVAEFSSRLGASYRSEQNVNKRIEGLQALLKAMENPSKVRIAGEHWWSRIWRRWTWR
jgi:hypothetical protein